MEWVFILVIIIEAYCFLMDGNLISGFIAILATIIRGFIIEQNKEVNNKHSKLDDGHNCLHDDHTDIMNSISSGNKTIDTVNHYILNEKERQARIETKLDGKIQAGIKQGTVAAKLLVEQLVESKQEVADLELEVKGLKEEMNQLKEENQKLKQENVLLRELASKERESFSYGKEQSKDDFELEL